MLGAVAWPVRGHHAGHGDVEKNAFGAEAGDQIDRLPPVVTGTGFKPFRVAATRPGCLPCRADRRQPLLSRARSSPCILFLLKRWMAADCGRFIDGIGSSYACVPCVKRHPAVADFGVAPDLRWRCACARRSIRIREDHQPCLRRRHPVSPRNRGRLDLSADMSSQLRPGPRRPIRALLSGPCSAWRRSRCAPALQPLLADQLPFVVAFPATVVASVTFGWRAGACVAIHHRCGDRRALHTARPAGIGPTHAARRISDRQRSHRPLLRHAPRPGTPEANEVQGTRFETPLTRWLRAVLWGAFLVPVIAFAIAAWWGFERAQREAISTVSHAADLAHGHASARVRRRFRDRAPCRCRLGRRRRGRASAGGGHPPTAGRHHRGPAPLSSTSTYGTPRADLWCAATSIPWIPPPALPICAYFIEQKTKAVTFGISDVIKGRQTGAGTHQRHDQAQHAGWQLYRRGRGVDGAGLLPRLLRVAV